MRILILNWRDIKNPSSGGAEVLTQEIAKRWVKWGHQVTQFSSSFQGGLAEEIVDGVKIIRRGHPDARYFFQSVHFLAFWYYLKNFKGNFDVVIDEIHGLPFFTPWYVNEKKIVLICEVAGELWKKIFGPIFGSLGLIIEQFYLGRVYQKTPFLTISESSKEDLVKNGVEEKNIAVLPMGISIPDHVRKFRKEKDPTLVFVGRLSTPKGVEDAILSLKEIYKRNPQVKLWIVGRGESQYVGYLKKLSGKLKVHDRVTFFGFVSEKEKFALMGRAHVLIHPSLREGFGLTIPEAGLVNTPVVAYNSPGIRDVIKNNKNGILLKDNSPKSIANEVMSLLNTKSRYKRLCRGAQLEATRYNWDKTAEIALFYLEKLQDL